MPENKHFHNEHAAYDGQPLTAQPFSTQALTAFAAAPIHSQPPARWRVFKFLCGLLLGMGTVTLAAVLFVLGLFMLTWTGRGRILPQVTVLDLPLSGYNQEEATAALDHYWQSLSITLLYNGQATSVTPAELGMILNTTETSQTAVAMSQTLDPRTLIEFYRAGAYIIPTWELDVPIATQTLEEIAPSLTLPAVDAGVQFVDGQLIATAAYPGSQLDIEQTLHQLQQTAGQVILNRRLELVMQPVSPNILSTNSIIAETNGRLQTDLPIRLFDPVNGEQLIWQLPATEWGQWLTLSQPTPDQLTWEIKTEQVNSYLNTQVARLGNGRYLDATHATDHLKTLTLAQINGHIQDETPSSLRIYHSARQHIVQAGETYASIGRAYGMPYPWVQEANLGMSDLSIGQAITIPSADKLLPLSVVEHKRVVVSISEQRLWAYEYGEIKWDWAISTGIAESPTSPGVFQIQTHEENAYAGNWDLWMPNFMGIYRPVPTSDFMNGFHGFPTRNGSNLLWTNSLGTPVTYGCILVENNNMAELFQWAEAGVVVEVIQ